MPNYANSPWMLTPEPGFTQAVVDSQRAAIERIAAFVKGRHIECQFERLPGYLYTESEKDVQSLEHEADVARQLGLAVEATMDTPLPFPVVKALRFDVGIGPNLGLSAGIPVDRKLSSHSGD